MKSKKGITLIVLVVTIIIILILAGVTISSTIGSDGILNKTQNESNDYVIAADKEAINISYMAVKMGKIKNNNDGSVEAGELQEKLRIDGYEEAIVTPGSDFLVVTMSSKNKYKVSYNGNSLVIEEY